MFCLRCIFGCNEGPTGLPFVVCARDWKLPDVRQESKRKQNGSRVT